VDGGECAAAGTLLCLRGAAAVGALGAREDAAGGNEEDVAVGELLLELAGQAGREVLVSHGHQFVTEVDVLSGRNEYRGRRKHTAAGPCGSLEEGEQGRRRQWTFCHGQPQSRRILVSASNAQN